VTVQKIGKRRTQQREAVLSILQETVGPLSINDIHDLATEYCPDIGIATVYRTIKLLLEKDQVVQVILPDGIGRYELPDAAPHQHFLCEECGRAFDLDLGKVSWSKSSFKRKGFRVEDQELCLLGSCPDCR